MRFQLLKITALLLLPLFAQAADICENWQMKQSPGLPATEPHSQSFLWKISKPGVQPSYLLGSFHSHTGNILKNWEGLIVLLARMRSFLSETSFAQDDSFAFGRLTLSKEPALASILGPNYFEKAHATLLGYGLSEDTISHLKTWAAFLQMVQPQKAQSLDAFLFAQSLKVPLQMRPLQNAEEMAASAEAISKSDQLSILKDTICNRAMMMEQTNRLQQLYLEDNVAGFLAENDHWTSSHPGVSARLTEALVTNRNAIFLPKLRPALEAGSAFIAVGASHLFGKKGLILTLEAQGYELQPLSRESLMKDLFAEANSEANGIASELTEWLRTQKFQVSSSPITIRFIPTAELEKRACGGSCEASFFLQDGILYASIEHYQELRNRIPRASAAVLGQIIHANQVSELSAKGENHCWAWNQKNVENIILQGRYLSRIGLPVAGLSSFDVPNDCVL